MPRSDLRETVWTPARRWIGNLIPMAGWLPLEAASVMLAMRGADPWGMPLALAATGTVLGWILTNEFGLWQNSTMLRELRSLLSGRGMQGPFDAFVGCSSPRHFGVLDAHENVGFLILDEDLRVVCENTTLRLPRSQIVEVRLRPNVHSWLGLGRWVSVEGEGIRLYLEPRNARTLLANRRSSGPLLERIRRWRAA